MRFRVYRSLDQSSSFFGLRGRFIFIVAAAACAGLVFGIVVGSSTTMIFGIGTFLLCVVVAYFVTMSIQEKVDEKDLMKTVDAKAFPEYYTSGPRTVYDMLHDGLDEPEP